MSKITAEVFADHQHGPGVTVCVDGVQVSVYLYGESGIVATDEGQYGIEVNGPWPKLHEHLKLMTEAIAAEGQENDWQWEDPHEESPDRCPTDGCLLKPGHDGKCFLPNRTIMRHKEGCVEWRLTPDLKCSGCGAEIEPLTAVESQCPHCGQVDCGGCGSSK